MTVAVIAGLTGALGIVAFGEVASWVASRRDLGGGRTARSGGEAASGEAASEGAGFGAAASGEAARRHAVVVLGYRNPDTRINAINRFRVRAGLRSIDSGAETVLVLCGGAVAGEIPEAELMRRYARDSRGFTGPIRLDTASTSTWENVACAIPLIEDAKTIAIVSNSHHAQKARICLGRLRPDLAERLVRGADYRLGELWWVKPVEAVLGLISLRRLRHT